jgi:phosphoribosylglycinamide formyltransferase 1
LTIKTKIAVLISGNGSNLQALIDACAAPDFPAEIALVISNKADAYGLKRAELADIPICVISHRDFTDRNQFDDAMHQKLLEYNIEMVCLAGFMRLLTPDFTNKWEGNMLNIHPSLLPNYKGLDTHARVLAAGEKHTGATVHYVVAEMDAGEIILQQKVDINEDDTAITLQKKVHRVEHIIYPKALKIAVNKYQNEKKS